MSVARPAPAPGPYLGIDAEKATLGACLGNDSAAAQAATVVRPDDFALDRDRRIATAIFRMAAEGRAIDPLTVAIEMKADDELKAYLHTLTSPGVCPAASNVLEYAKFVQRNSLQRQLTLGLQGILANLGQHSPSGSAIEVVKHGLGGLLEMISQSEAVEAPRFVFRNAVELCSMTPEHPKWIVEGLVAAGCITEWGAKIKTGKTDTVVALAACVLEGRPFLGLKTSRMPIVFVTEERAATFRSVLARHHLDKATDLHVLLRQDIARDAEWPDIVEAALRYVREVGAGLLIADTFSDLANVQDENDAAEALRASRPLQQAAESGLGVIATCHHRKGGGALGESRRGSSAFGGAVDIIVSLTRVTGTGHDNRRELTAVGRFDEVPPRLVIERGPDHVYASLGDGSQALSLTASQIVLAVLATGRANALLAEQVVERIQAHEKIGRTLITDALKQLCDSGEVKGYKGAVAGRPRALGYWLPGDDDAQENLL
jgi:hypothetical protein